MRSSAVLIVAMSLGCQRPAATTLTVEPTTSVRPQCVSAPPATRLRRLTRLEWQATVKQVLAVDALLDVPDDEGLGFSTVADAQAASVSLSEKFLEAAERATASMNVTALSPCVPSDECAPRFLERLGERLFRRAMTPDELRRLTATWQRVRTTEDVETASRLVTQVMLQSPSFLFRLEQPRVDEPTLLDDDALSTRLAFALTGTGPDEALQHAARTGTLRTREGLRAEAERLLTTPAARRTMGRFHVEWLGLSSLTRLSRGAPDGGFEALAPSMEREVAELGAFVVLDDRHLSTLFAGDVTFVDPPLGALYGFTGLEGDGFRKVSLEVLQRSAVLTAPGVMAAWAKSTGTSPTLRGRFVRERLLCETLPTPPPNVSMTLPVATGGTTRTRFQQHVADQACSGCHLLIDPIGFGLERYDETGAFRLVENGRVIDAHGEVTRPEGSFRFEGARPLGQWLSEQPAVRACVARQWFRFTMGRAETAGDFCTIEAMTNVLTSTGGDVREALLTLVTSDSFRSVGGAP